MTILLAIVSPRWILLVGDYASKFEVSMYINIMFIR